MVHVTGGLGCLTSFNSGRMLEASHPEELEERRREDEEEASRRLI